MTTLPQQASRMTREALDALFRAAKQIPEDKCEWIPMGEARTVQGLLYECALTTPFYIAAVQGKMREFATVMPDEPTLELWQRRSEAATTLEGTEAVAHETFAELCAALEAVPEEKLADLHPHPMALDKQVTTADLLFLAYWNLVYHTGQINYLQMMLGDTQQQF